MHGNRYGTIRDLIKKKLDYSKIVLLDLDVKGVVFRVFLSNKNITFSNKVGESQGYSPYSYDIGGATQNQVIYPSLDPSIFEIKYPNTDINGRVTTHGNSSSNTPNLT